MSRVQAAPVSVSIRMIQTTTENWPDFRVRTLSQFAVPIRRQIRVYPPEQEEDGKTVARMVVYEPWNGPTASIDWGDYELITRENIKWTCRLTWLIRRFVILKLSSCSSARAHPRKAPREMQSVDARCSEVKLEYRGVRFFEAIIEDYHLQSPGLERSRR